MKVIYTPDGNPNVNIKRGCEFEISPNFGPKMQKLSVSKVSWYLHCY